MKRKGVENMSAQSSQSSVAKPNVIFASDHAGFQLKNVLLSHLSKLGYHVEDVGCYTETSCDYPDFAHQACKKIGQGFDCAVLFCGTGQGMAMTANTYERCRAAVVWDTDIAKATREHNNANVLCLPARHLSEDEAIQILETFFKTSSSTEERHERRVKKIKNDNIRLSEMYKKLIADIKAKEQAKNTEKIKSI